MTAFIIRPSVSFPAPLLHALFLTSLFLTAFLPTPAPAGEDYCLAVRRLAEQGDPQAQFSLAMMYDLGDGVERSPEQAVFWFSKAAEQNIAGACLYLGMKYEFGNGVEQDVNRAIHWYTLAAEQDWTMAQFLLGNLYLSGKDGPVDLVKAGAWLSLAAEQEYPGAQEMLLQIEQKLSKKEKDQKEKLLRQLKDTIKPQ